MACCEKGAELDGLYLRAYDEERRIRDVIDFEGDRIKAIDAASVKRRAAMDQAIQHRREVHNDQGKYEVHDVRLD